MTIEVGSREPGAAAPERSGDQLGEHEVALAKREAEQQERLAGGLQGHGQGVVVGPRGLTVQSFRRRP